MRRIFLSPTFLVPFMVTGVLSSAFFGWELGFFGDALPVLPRPEPTQEELLFTSVMILLLACSAGLAFFRIREGTCPVGTRRASAIAGGLGVITLLCPVCLLIPFTLVGLTITLSFLTPFLPLLRVIVILLLVTNIGMLWPKRRR